MLGQNAQSTTQHGFAEHVGTHGSSMAPYVQLIAQDFSILSGADIADIAHFLCILHGRHPGVIDNAATRIVDDAAREWLIQATDGFAAERAFLTKLTVSAGPISGVSASDQSNAAVHGQRKALDMLSQSDRNGCAVGAAIALVSDWQAIRKILEPIALRVGVEARSSILPDVASTAALKDELSQTAALERALNFGSEQLLNQHRGLWQLLEARRNTRISQ
ncbi:hypothetical protein HUO14_06675 [Parasphingorhabdus flavimaris]|jgi:hypothetical protein|uniref:Uncharacterized protein n=1 Tax=Parasphingorhabdus flavimaris TaxID=266812 RepID=A0ABX2N1K9_9SPHN|nr:hypothetical protein [Parasphingorhabdus flavimaris]NVD27586.1 hypothetical protein [Parasphingorhabdus flavimaris]|tara:strand:+ start:10382 stop:11041 length:660 start_codon:yes stop_codon:yes gene_type:complete